MTRTFEWSAIRNRATSIFGQAPNAELEAEILPVFQAQPEAVVAVLKNVSDAVRAGRVTAGWALARLEIRALTAPDTVATGKQEQEKQERVRQRALGWVRNVGALYERESEVHSELFGEHGRFKRWPELEVEVLEEWRARVGQASA